MKQENKKPKWITLPDKSSEKTNSKILSMNPDKVNNKIFWGIGFVALAVFSFILIMPGKFSELMQGDLFDGEFQLVPDVEDQEGGAFFGGTSNEEAETSEQDAEQVTVSGPTSSNSPNGSDAVPIQVNPVQSGNQQPQETATVDQPEQETQQPESEEGAAASAELQSLLESLSAQMELLKQESQKKDQQIQSLMEMLEAQQALHAAAKPETTEVPQSSQQNQQQTSSQNQTSPEINTTYRPNTHTVQLSPHQILAQKQSGQNQVQQQAPQANVTQAPTAPNTMALSGVNHQPTTGPMESMMVAFLLAALGMLGYGIYRSAKA